MPTRIIKKIYNQGFETPEYLKTSLIPSLDGLRAISILIVVFGHFKFSQNASPAVLNVLDIIIGGGQLGVKLFFVISGFLITSLLIKEKIKTNTINLRKFYTRRFLRIFPVFYLYLLALVILHWFLKIEIDTMAYIAAALYFTNFYMPHTNWAVMHSWSLAVEEQYYFLWPSVFKKNIKAAIVVAVAIVAITPIIRVVVYYYPNLTNVLLAPFLDGADSIFIGSLLAILSFKGCINWAWFRKHKVLITAACFLGMWFIAHSTLHGRYGKVLLPFGPTITAVLFSGVIIASVIPARDLFFKLFNSRPLVFIGRISYGIYVWQQVVLIASPGFPLKSFSWNSFPLNLILVAIISTLSYYCFERVFLKLKSKYRV